MGRPTLSLCTNFVAALAALAALPATAGAEPASTPAQAWVTDGTVEAMAESNGTIYLGGSFTRIGPRTGAFASLDPGTAAHDAAIPDVAGGRVEAIEADGSGGWYIGGSFQWVGGIQRDGLAHITSTGALDPGFDPAPAYAGGRGTVSDLALGGSTLYVAGNFDAIAGSARTNLAALDPSTGSATGWTPTVTRDGGSGVQTVASVDTLAIAGTEMYVGGNFEMIDAQPHGRLARFSLATGTPVLDAWNANITGPFPRVVDVAVSGATIFAAGTFSSAGGSPHANLVAFDRPTGAVLPANLNAECAYALAPGAADQAYVGTCGGSLGGSFFNSGISRVTRTGVDTGFAPSNTCCTVDSVAFSGGKVYAGGPGIGPEQRRLTAIDAATGNVDTWDPGLNAYVATVTVAGGRVLAGGDFSSAGGVRRRSLAAVDATSGMPTSWNPGTDGRVYALAVSGSTVYAGGDFQQAGAVSRSNLAAIGADGAVDQAWNPNPDDVVRAVAVIGSTVYAGGDFFQVGTSPQTRPHLAAFDASGAPTAWDPQANGRVHALEPGAAERLYVGGEFSTVGGMTRSRLAEVSLDAPSAAATDWNPNPDGAVYALERSGESVYAGGGFSQIGASGERDRPRLAELSAATGAATAWNPSPNGSVEDVAVVGSIVYAGGSFSLIGAGTDRARPFAAGIDAASAAPTAWTPRPSSSVYALEHTGSALAIGGQFNALGTISQRGFALFADAGTGSGGGEGGGDGTPQEQPPPSGTAAQEPPPPGAAALALDPATATPAVTQRHVVVASASNVPAGTAIRWFVTGANSASGVSHLDSEGRATLSWVGRIPRRDTLTAYADLDGDGSASGGEPTATATADWRSLLRTERPVEQAATLDELSDPTPTEEFNVQPTRGVVYVDFEGAPEEFVPLETAAQLPIGAVLDTRRGTVAIESAADLRGDRTQRASFYSGIFQVRQPRAATLYTDMVMRGGTFGDCAPRSRRASEAARRRPVRRLWGDGRGRFRTHGRYSAATIRGTKWLVEDRCDGTFTRVVRGRVEVRGTKVRRRAVVLRAGQSILVRAPRSRR